MGKASLGIDYAVQGAINLWVAWARPAAEGRSELLSLLFHEERPDLGEIGRISETPFGAVPGDSPEVFLPWANYNRMTSLWLWHAWLQGDQIAARAAPAGPAASVAAGGVPARFIRPALTVSSGELDLLYITGNRELALARFVPGQGGAAPSGSILWRMALPSMPVAGRAALGSERQRSPRRAMLVFQDNADLEVQLHDLAEGRRPGPPQIVRIPNAIALPGGEPGLRVDEEGVTHGSLLLISDRESNEISIADLVFKQPRPEEPAIAKLRALPLPPVAGGIAYQSRTDRPMRRDWVVLLPDGNAFHSFSDEQPMRPRGMPVTPLELVARSQATYMLSITAEGPVLDSLK